MVRIARSLSGDATGGIAVEAAIGSASMVSFNDGVYGSVRAVTNVEPEMDWLSMALEGDGGKQVELKRDVDAPVASYQPVTSKLPEMAVRVLASGGGGSQALAGFEALGFAQR